MLFFTSDTHFNHKNTLSREKRLFDNTLEFDEFVLGLWNNQVKKGDIIYHLGDFINYSCECDRNSYKTSITYPQKINCDVILIIGNNEERVIDNEFNGDFNLFKNYAIDSGFKDVLTEEYIEFGHEKFYLNHFPRNHKDGYVNLFGHVHRITGIYKPYGLNVGCDLNNYELYTQEEILGLLKNKRLFWDNDIDINTN